MVPLKGSSRSFRKLFCSAIFILILYSIFKADGDSVSPHKQSFSCRLPGSATSWRCQNHTYRDDGLLEVNPLAAHPIPILIERAKEEWETKLKKQSQTLRKAVKEYKRRYGRPPPQGFDLWWEYVQDNDVQMPDEYDSIHEKMQLFWAADPLDLQQTLTEWEDNHWSSITFGLPENGHLKIFKNAINHLRDSQELAELMYARLLFLSEIEDILPPFRAVGSPFDNPNLIMHWDFKSKIMQAIAEDRYINASEPPPHTAGWLGPCHPQSPAVRSGINLTAKLPNDYQPHTKKMFIYDHRSAMDPCLHPSHFLLEGQFINHRGGPGHSRRLTPQFSYSATTLHYDLPFLPMDDFDEDYQDIPWRSKRDDRLLWRGRDTGMGMGTSNWEQSQRPRLVRLGTNLTGSRKVLPSVDGYWSKSIGDGEEWPQGVLAPIMLDVAFGGEPVNCEDDHCDLLKKVLPWKPWMSLDEANSFKYIMDVDGHAWSSRFRRLMLSNSLILKSTVYPEWWTERVQPWLHFVPISLDYSELFDVLTYFRGDARGRGKHDNVAEHLATAGRQWAETFWRKEDSVAYMFRLILEYVRVTSPDRDYLYYEP